MADQLKSVSIAAPGFFGLNNQESGVTLSSGFALTADNCVIDKYGRIGARKGWQPVHSVSAALGSNNITAIYEFVKSNGDKEIICTGNKNVFKLVGTTLTSIYYDASLTADNWKIVQLKDRLYFFQANAETLTYDGTTVAKISTVSGYAGTCPQGNVVTAAFGRLWVANTTTNKVTLYWCDLLNGLVWNTGSAGSLDLTTVFPNGMDEIMGVAAHNGFLVILCRKCIIIYTNASIPASIALQDILTDVGCIARGSIQTTGADLIFLSDKGVVSLGTLVQEKSIPQNDLSKNVRDELLQSIIVSDFDNIKSVYYPKEAFYLLTIPSLKQVYCFDMRGRLENGAARVTVWQNIEPKAFTVLRDRSLYIGFAGYVGNYTGYTDNGVKYRMVYYTNYFNFGEESATTLKFLKRINFVVIGGQNQGFVTKWAFDYSSAFQAATTTLPKSSVAEYNVSQFNVDEYASGIVIAKVSQQASGSGTLVQVGVETDIYGSPLSIQKIDVFVKTGKLL